MAAVSYVMGMDRPSSSPPSLLAVRGISIAVLVAVAACSPRVITDVFAPGGSSAITSTTQDIRAEAESTIKIATDGAAIAPEVPAWPMILSSQDRIIGYTVELDGHTKALKASELECAKLREKAGRWEAAAYGLFIIFGGIGLVAAPVLAYFVAPKLGMALALAGATSIGVGMTLRAVAGFFSEWGWAISAGIVGLTIFGLALTGWAWWKRARREDSTADDIAQGIKDVLDESKPGVTVKTLMESIRARLPLIDRALSKLEPKP